MKFIKITLVWLVTSIVLAIPACHLVPKQEAGKSKALPRMAGNKGNESTVTVCISSLAGDRLTKKPDLCFDRSTLPGLRAIRIDASVKYQMIEGFGASFNEAGMICLNSLGTSARDSVLRALFDPDAGAGYTLMKSPIAACDFASAGQWYSYNDTPGDTLMRNFSIERDLGPNGLITFIKNAARFGTFRIESPMDFAPDWMLYSLKDGEKHVRKEYYPALALYYSKYISEYARNGVTIDFLNPFNEPQNRWYSNETYKAIGLMVKDYIIPRFRTDNIKTRIQLCETANRPEAVQKLPDALDDPEVKKYIHSITVHGYDWNQFSALEELHKKYPDLPIWQTEVCYAGDFNVPENGPGKLPVYDFADGEFWGNMIMNDLKNHASAWIYWNMILDENGGPWLISIEHGDPDNNFQHPVVIINRQTKQVTYTGLYYYLAHFSKFVRPGAHRIECSGGSEQFNFAAFQNIDSTIILIIINNGGKTESQIQWNNAAVKFHVPAHSISTVKWKG
jgi:glucosylceramidase